jgi:NAD(P)-dependent dehydrogenase (short-subunit alcohol dehydrogenase family)
VTRTYVVTGSASGIGAATAHLLADAQEARTLGDTVPMPLGGIAEPGAVATVLAFLTGEGLQSVTGQVLFVDGGADCVTRGDAVF